MLSLCMIVKNEEKEISQFLEHIHSFVDEIIIVDTGSTDDTKKIAKSFSKVKIFDFTWVNDFSKARNESLKHAKGDWILVLDADERLSKDDFEKIKERILNKKYFGYVLTQRNYMNETNTRNFKNKQNDTYTESTPYLGWTENTVVRLFQRRPDIFYCYKVHELVEPSIEAAGGKVKKTEIPIHHYGQTNPKKLEKKFKLYSAICEQKCQEDPGDDRAWFEHGINQLKLGAYEKAAQSFENVYDVNPVHPYVGAYLIEVYGKLENAAGVIHSYHRGVESNAMDINLYLNIGEIFFVNGKYNEAWKAYSQALHIDKKNVVAWFGVGISYYHLKEYEKASKAFKNVLKLYPEHPKAKELLAKIEG